MKRKLLVMFLAIAMLLTMTPMSAFAGEALPDGTFVIERTGIEATGVYNRSGYGVVSFQGPYGEDGDDISWPWYGLVDKEGNYVIPAKPSQNDPRHNTFANTFFISDGIICDYNKGYYNLDGTEAFDLMALYDTELGEGAYISELYAMPFYDGKAIVQINYEEEWSADGAGGFNYDASPYMVIDKEGNVLKEMDEFPGKYYGGEGFTQSTNSSDQAIFYDYDGNTVIDLKDRGYNGFTGTFFGGYAWVKNKTTGLLGYIDKTGAEVIPCEYDDAAGSGYGLFPVKKDGMWGCINADNEIVVPCEYSDAFPFGEGLIAVCQDGKYGVIDSELNPVIPLEWDDISSFDEGAGYAIKDGELYTISRESGETPKDGWAEDEYGYKCYYENGEKVTGWKDIDGARYYFELQTGRMVDGGVTNIDGKLFYFGSDGKMQTGWIDHMTDRFYAEKTGVLAEGWKQIDGAWYYFEPQNKVGYGGYMRTSMWMKDSKGWCWLQEDGKMLTNGWAKDSVGTCWIASNGYMPTTTQWIQYDGSWYHITKGYRDESKWMKDSKGWCWLQEDGKMLTNGWAKDSIGTCWIAANGYMPTTTQWIQYEGSWYHITKGYRDESKWMKDSKGWCWLQADGKMLTNGWAKDSKGWCWIAANGYMPTTTQWIKYDGGWYYIEKGYRVQNAWRKDSKGWCYLGPEGRMVTEDFVKDSKGMCWIGEDGYMLVETKVLYLDNGTYGIKDGYMVVNGSIEINGTVYVFGNDGKLITVGM